MENSENLLVISIYFLGLFVALVILGYIKSRKYGYLILQGELLCFVWPLTAIYFVCKFIFNVPVYIGASLNSIFSQIANKWFVQQIGTALNAFTEKWEDYYFLN